jgi:hypothetical protein
MTNYESIFDSQISDDECLDKLQDVGAESAGLSGPFVRLFFAAAYWLSWSFCCRWLKGRAERQSIRTSARAKRLNCSMPIGRSRD